jgi:hypothetical protein
VRPVPRRGFPDANESRSAPRRLGDWCKVIAEYFCISEEQERDKRRKEKGANNQGETLTQRQFAEPSIEPCVAVSSPRSSEISAQPPVRLDCLFIHVISPRPIHHLLWHACARNNKGNIISFLFKVGSSLSDERSACLPDWTTSFIHVTSAGCSFFLLLQNDEVFCRQQGPNELEEILYSGWQRLQGLYVAVYDGAPPLFPHLTNSLTKRVVDFGRIRHLYSPRAACRSGDTLIFGRLVKGDMQCLRRALGDVAVGILTHGGVFRRLSIYSEVRCQPRLLASFVAFLVTHLPATIVEDDCQVRRVVPPSHPERGRRYTKEIAPIADDGANKVRYIARDP